MSTRIIKLKTDKTCLLFETTDVQSKRIKFRNIKSLVKYLRKNPINCWMEVSHEN